FNPATLGIYPFDKFTCRVHLNKRLRDLIFPKDKTLEKVTQDVTSFHKDLIKNRGQVLAIGSGSSNELLAEYAQYGTIGEHILNYVSPTKQRIFSQQPNEIITLGYTSRDLEESRERLRLLEKNVPIQNYKE
ncbi:MAG: hypothetical protein KC506_02890, partial [Nanoarchaeota archaeon]|nr:hypothetical protein [Nanoarchaeota archaeon]